MFPCPRLSTDLETIRLVGVDDGLDLSLHCASGTAAAPCGSIATMRLTVIVVLEGTYVFAFDAKPERRVRAGERLVVAAEDVLTNVAWSAGNGRARAIAIAIAPAMFSAIVDDAELRFSASVQPAGARLVERAFAWAGALAGDGPIPAEDVRAEVLGVLGTAARIERDVLDRVRHAIDRTHDAPLYIRHYAEEAGMHPVRLSRAFAGRFGVTPIRYRLLRRAHEAARRLAMRPQDPVVSVAYATGFLDLRFFRRTLREIYGASPSELQGTVATRRRSLPALVAPDRASGPVEYGAISDVA